MVASSPSSIDDQPHVIRGGSHTDERGTISFVNSFDFAGVERFYTIQSAHVGAPRGWIGHRREEKWFYAAHGDVMIGVVAPDDWSAPSPDLPVSWFDLRATSPGLLHVPPGFATVIVQVTEGAVLVVFSSGRIDDAPSDHFRFPLTLWPAQPTGDPD